jgi:DnaK suppressor protein
MNEIEIINFRKKLLKLQLELNDLSDTADDATKSVELDQSAVGRLSRMDAMRAQGMAIETRARRKQQLLNIKSALQRIAAGGFGNCLVCGKEINMRKLDVDPSYTQCIKCAEK